MCLKNITWQAKSNSNTKSKDKWSKGYKVFTVDGDKIFSLFYSPIKAADVRHTWQRTPEHQLEIGKIYKCFGTGLIYCNDYKDRYKPGFHIFPVAIQAKLFSGISQDRYRNIFEVEYRKVTAIGTHSVHTDYPVDCIIANEMRIVRCLSIQEIEQILKDEEKISRND